MRVIKALKKSQEIVTKSNRSHVQSSMILTNCDVNEKSIVMEKLRGRRDERKNEMIRWSGNIIVWEDRVNQSEKSFEGMENIF